MYRNDLIVFTTPDSKVERIVHAIHNTLAFAEIMDSVKVSTLNQIHDGIEFGYCLVGNVCFEVVATISWSDASNRLAFGIIVHLLFEGNSVITRPDNDLTEKWSFRRTNQSDKNRIICIEIKTGIGLIACKNLEQFLFQVSIVTF